MHREDGEKNSHVLILGPADADKSALLVYLLRQMAAVYRPRRFIIVAGSSFALLAQYFHAHGLTVNLIASTPIKTYPRALGKTDPPSAQRKTAFGSW